MSLNMFLIWQAATGKHCYLFDLQLHFSFKAVQWHSVTVFSHTNLSALWVADRAPPAVGPCIFLPPAVVDFSVHRRATPGNPTAAADSRRPETDSMLAGVYTCSSHCERPDNVPVSSPSPPLPPSLWPAGEARCEISRLRRNWWTPASSFLSSDIRKV